MARGPIAQSLEDFVRLVGRKIVGGGESGRKQLSRAERKAQGAAETLRASREMRVGSAVLGAVALLIVSSFIFQARGGTGPPAQPIETLSPTDTTALRTVFFGAAPSVIECTTPRTDGGSVLQEAAAQRLIPDGVRAARLDCQRPMAPGEPNTLDRFGIAEPASSGPPLLLISGHGLSAPQPLGRHGTPTSLARHLKRWAQPQVQQLNSTLDLHRHCLSRPACLLLLSKGKASAAARGAVLKALGSSHRELGVASLNTKTHEASFSSQIPSTHRAVLIALRATDAAPLAAEAKAFRGVVSAENQLDVDAFVSTVASARTDGFVRLERPAKVALADAVPGEAMASEELYDPLLSKKRYDRESRLAK